MQEKRLVFAPPHRRGAQTRSRVVAFAFSPIAALARAAPTHATHDRPRPRDLHDHHARADDDHHHHHNDCADSKHHHDCRQHHRCCQHHRCHHHAADKADRRVVVAARWRGARATAQTERRARAVAAQRGTRTMMMMMMMTKRRRQWMTNRWECA